jgi:hypothetical protein
VGTWDFFNIFQRREQHTKQPEWLREKVALTDVVSQIDTLISYSFFKNSIDIFLYLGIPAPGVFFR